MSNLALRVLSALVLIPLTLAVTWFGTPWFELYLVLAAVLMLVEWRMMTAAGRQPLWIAAGALYVAAFAFGMEALRLDPAHGAWLVFYLFACIWATDTGAYFAGRAIGGPKLAPHISPNKTWAGFFGGLGGGLLAGGAMAGVLGAPLLAAALAGVFVSLCGQFGDLLESAVKRRFDVKDSGRIIPGHGGVLDRVDSLVTGAPALALLVLISGGAAPLGR